MAQEEGWGISRFGSEQPHPPVRPPHPSEPVESCETLHPPVECVPYAPIEDTCPAPHFVQRVRSPLPQVQWPIIEDSHSGRDSNDEMHMDTPPQVPEAPRQYPEQRGHPRTQQTYSEWREEWSDAEMGSETEGVWHGWEERVMSRVHKEYIQPGMMGMKERTDALIERLDRV